MVTAAKSEDRSTEFALHGNLPNPFNLSTRIQVDIPEPAEVAVEVLDMLGMEVLNLPGQRVNAGSSHSIELNAANLVAGTYLYKMIVT